MSDPVEDAIRAAVAAENPGSIVTGWVVIAAATVPGDDATAYAYTRSDGPIHSTLGLVEMARRHFASRIGDAE